MHEWTMASRLISAVQDYVKSEGGGRVVSAMIKIGTLSMIDPETMKEALVTLSKSAGIEGLEFEVELADTRFECRRCGAQWSFGDVEKDLLQAVPPELMILDESGHRDAPTHYLPELIYAWMKCPKCASKNYDIADVSGAVLESVVLEK